MKADSNTYVQNLKSRIAALEQLLDVYENTAIEQTEELYEEVSARKESEKQALIFKRFSEASGQSFGMAALDGAIIYMNPTLCRLLGERDPKDACGKKVFQYYPELMSERMQKEIIPSVMETGQWTGELCLLNGRGGCTPTIENIFLIRDEDGTPFCIANLLTDITERKQAEEALKAASAKSRELEFIISRSPAVAWLWKAEPGWPVEYVSGNLSLYGYHPDDFTSGRIAYSSIVHPDDLPRIGAEVEQYAREGKNEFTQEYRIFSKSGDVRWIDDRTWVRRGPDGLATHYQGIVIDITDRKRSEEALRFNNERFQSIMDSVDALIYAATFDTHDILFFNKKMIDTFGDGVGKKCWQVIQTGQKGPCPFCSNEKLLTPDGQATGVYVWEFQNTINQRWYECRDAAIRWPDGRLVRMEIATDITVRKQAVEEVNRLNEQLEQIVQERTRQLVDAQEELVRKEKLAILGRLAGSVGHELRNPLGVMSNAVYFLNMVLSDADETTKEYLNIIKHEIDHSQRIIADLLDFARTKAPQRKSATVDEMMSQSLGRCNIPQNVSLTTELPDSLPSVNVDPLQMGQVFDNLIMNAVQAMPEGGMLTIKADQEKDAVKIRIIDTGEGISEENMTKLFQPLFTTKAKGIGLGLTVCRNLTEANGGRIEAESRSGEGTAFTVILPIEGNHE